MSLVVAQAPVSSGQALQALSKIAAYSKDDDIRITSRLTVLPVRSKWHKFIASITCQCFFPYKKYEKTTNIEETYSALKYALLTVLDQQEYSTNPKSQRVCQKVIKIFNKSLDSYAEAKRTPLSHFQLDLNALAEEARLARCERPHAQYARLIDGSIDYDRLLQQDHSPSTSPGRSERSYTDTQK